jgi:serine acetyltransferase
VRSLWLRLWLYSHGKDILPHHLVEIVGAKNIESNGRLDIGTSFVGFSSRHDRTLIRVRGRLVTSPGTYIGRGCHFDIGPDAMCRIGRSYILADTTVIVMNKLTIGDGCAISWGCQFLDDDFHLLHYNGSRPKSMPIVVGDHVWIGSRVLVLKGVTIPSGCVVAAGSIVTRMFDEENVLIAGQPARVIKHGIRWGGKAGEHLASVAQPYESACATQKL